MRQQILAAIVMHVDKEPGRCSRNRHLVGSLFQESGACRRHLMCIEGLTDSLVNVAI